MLNGIDHFLVLASGRTLPITDICVCYFMKVTSLIILFVEPATVTSTTGVMRSLYCSQSCQDFHVNILKRYS
jgi:hypothetical protein